MAKVLTPKQRKFFYAAPLQYLNGWWATYCHATEERERQELEATEAAKTHQQKMALPDVLQIIDRRHRQDSTLGSRCTVAQERKFKEEDFAELRQKVCEALGFDADGQAMLGAAQQVRDSIAVESAEKVGEEV